MPYVNVPSREFFPAFTFKRLRHLISHVSQGSCCALKYESHRFFICEVESTFSCHAHGGIPEDQLSARYL